jgi:FAD/FMN-containing dehydrogenase
MPIELFPARQCELVMARMMARLAGFDLAPRVAQVRPGVVWKVITSVLLLARLAASC